MQRQVSRRAPPKLGVQLRNDLQQHGFQLTGFVQRVAEAALGAEDLARNMALHHRPALTPQKPVQPPAGGHAQKRLSLRGAPLHQVGQATHPEELEATYLFARQVQRVQVLGEAQRQVGLFGVCRDFPDFPRFCPQGRQVGHLQAPGQSGRRAQSGRQLAGGGGSDWRYTTP